MRREGPDIYPSPRRRARAAEDDPQGTGMGGERGETLERGANTRTDILSPPHPHGWADERQ